MQKRKFRAMFITTAVFALLTPFFNMFYLIYILKDTSSQSVSFMAVLSAISAIVGVGFIVFACIKDDEKLYNLINVIKLFSLLAVFGSLITLIFAWTGYNRLKFNYLVDKGIIDLNNNKIQFNNFFAQEAKEETKETPKEDVIENEVVEEGEMTYESFQKELDKLVAQLESKKISEDEFYAKKSELLKRYYK